MAGCRAVVGLGRPEGQLGPSAHVLCPRGSAGGRPRLLERLPLRSTSSVSSSSSPGKPRRRLADTCSGDHLRASRRTTSALRRGSRSSLPALGLEARSRALLPAWPAS